MRALVGVGVLVIGLLALGWWAKVQYAPFIEATVSAQAQVIGAGSVHGVAVQVSGRDITVSGLADGAGERDRLIEALGAATGRRVVNDRLTVLPIAAPFTLDATGLEGVITMRGHAPNDATRSLLGTRASGELVLAAGVPDADWDDAALMGLAALAVFEDGRLSISDRTLALSGLLMTPDAEAAIREAMTMLPAGYEVSYDVRFVDDGTPPAYRLRYAAAEGAHLDGKLPVGVSGEQIAAALGVSVLDDAASVARIGDAGVVSPVFAALAPWLVEVETLSVAVGPDGTRVEAGFGAGADIELLGAALGADLAAVARGLSLSLSEVIPTQAAGARRHNLAAARDEVLSGGYWLPAPGFIPDAATCDAEVTATLTASRIGFVTGSARLDARARSAVNRLAGVLGPCLRDAGLAAEIGGHTDSTGSDEANLALSRARADAVRAALLARGLPEAGLSAQGYGAAQPIADNATEEGRAANRRTAVRWIE